MPACESDKPTKPILSDLTIALIEQVVALLVAAMVLDMGQVLSAAIYSSLGYWASVVFIFTRRRDALTKGDRQFIRVGLLVILAVGIPMFLAIWKFKGVI